MTFSFRNRAMLHYSTGKKIGVCRIVRGNTKRFSGKLPDTWLVLPTAQNAKRGKQNKCHTSHNGWLCGRRVNKRHYLKVAYLLLCFKELSYLSVQRLLSFTPEHLVTPTRKPRDAQILGARSSELCTMTPNTCGSSIRSLLRFTLLTPRILGWLLDFFLENLWTIV